MYFIYLFSSLFFAEISCLAHGACIGYSSALTLTDNVGLSNCRYLDVENVFAHMEKL